MYFFQYSDLLPKDTQKKINLAFTKERIAELRRQLNIAENGIFPAQHFHDAVEHYYILNFLHDEANRQKSIESLPPKKQKTKIARLSSQLQEFQKFVSCNAPSLKYISTATDDLKTPAVLENALSAMIHSVQNFQSNIPIGKAGRHVDRALRTFFAFLLVIYETETGDKANAYIPGQHSRKTNPGLKRQTYFFSFIKEALPLINRALSDYAIESFIKKTIQHRKQIKASQFYGYLKKTMIP